MEVAILVVVVTTGDEICRVQSYVQVSTLSGQNQQTLSFICLSVFFLFFCFLFLCVCGLVVCNGE